MTSLEQTNSVAESENGMVVDVSANQAALEGEEELIDAGEDDHFELGHMLKHKFGKRHPRKKEAYTYPILCSW